MQRVAIAVLAVFALTVHADEPARGSAAAFAPGPDQIALVVRPAITRWGAPVEIVGEVASGRANEGVTVQFKGCGLYPQQFSDIAEATTREGGQWSVDWLRGSGPGAYRAVWRGAVSSEVTVQGRPHVLLRREGGTWDVWVTAALQFYGRRVVIERLNHVGVWVASREVRLNRQMANNPQFGNAPFIATGAEGLRLRLPRKSTIRAVLRRSAARPCYLAGYSNIVRT